MAKRVTQQSEAEWVSFPGGELEGKRPKALCAACRARLQRRALSSRPTEPARTLCFACYRTELDRQRAIKAAADLDTASADRFQTSLPFEPVDLPRLAALKTERAIARATVSPFVDRRRQAQIAARHALQRIADGLASRPGTAATMRDPEMADAIHAAELQLPDAWLPFVVAR